MSKITLQQLPSNDIFHVTEIRTFLRCRRRWDYSSPNRQNLTRLVDQPALTLGTLLHVAHDAWRQQYADYATNGESYDVPLEVLFEENAALARENIALTYREQVGFKISDIELADFDKNVKLGIAMCQNYAARYPQPFPKGLTFVAGEQTIVVDIPNRPYKIAGRLDAIVRGPSGRLWVWDLKSFDKHPDDQDLDADEQFLSYLMLAQLAYPNDTVAGVVYDGVWKRPAPPKGRDFADLFYRREIYRNKASQQEWLANVEHILDDMSDDPSIYPARDWTCGMCGFREICLAQTNGEDVSYLRKHLYRLRTEKELTHDGYLLTPRAGDGVAKPASQTHSRSVGADAAPGGA